MTRVHANAQRRSVGHLFSMRNWMRPGQMPACKIFTTMAILTLALTSCRHPLRAIPPAPPDYSGWVISRSFARDSAQLSGMYRFAVAGSGRSGATDVPEAHIRTDSATEFASTVHGGIDWRITGLPEFGRSFVRIWLRGNPTSLTATELWGQARLVVVDSVKPAPKTGTTAE
jgi:hypothetical protein